MVRLKRTDILTIKFVHVENLQIKNFKNVRHEFKNYLWGWKIFFFNELKIQKKKVFGYIFRILFRYVFKNSIRTQQIY